MRIVYYEILNNFTVIFIKYIQLKINPNLFILVDHSFMKYFLNIIII